MYQVRNSTVLASGDLEDAVQYETAIANQLEVIVTRNSQDFVTDALQILTPEGLI
jgi:hypothetical protein